MTTTASILSLPDAAKLLSLPPLILSRAAVRGRLKINMLNGTQRVLMRDLESWVSSAGDDVMPVNDNAWFSGENDLRFLHHHAQNLVAASVTESTLDLASVQKDYDEKVLIITRAFRFTDPSRALQGKPSTILKMASLAQKYDAKYPSIILGVMVELARNEAYRVITTNGLKSAENFGKSHLEMLYTPGIYEQVIKAVPEAMNRIFATNKLSVKVKNKLTGQDVSVPVNIEVKLASSVLPNINDVMRLAF
jgi:hypothetical protein